jgi:hypothetical protein
METMAGTTMRGFAGADQVLVLYDGVPLNNGYVGRVQFNTSASPQKGAFSTTVTQNVK